MTGASERPSVERILLDRMTALENGLARLKAEVATKDDVQTLREDIGRLVELTGEVLAIVRETAERVHGIDGRFARLREALA